MTHTKTATRGMVVAPHHLAAESGVAVMRDGGNALEAMVCAAATIAAVYPHMNGIGGDGFWLIHTPGHAPIAIDACGRSAAHATLDFYAGEGLAEIPTRGPLAANTVAATVSGWAEALAISAEWGGRLPLARLLEDSIHYTGHGVPVTGSLNQNTREKLPGLESVPGFTETFLPGGAIPEVGARFVQPRLSATLQHLATKGLDEFYRGDLAWRIAADLERVGSPVTLADLEAQRATRVEPLRLRTALGEAYNFPPPTQGFASLIILGLFERLGGAEAEGFEYVHALVEATKQAFMVRDRELTDPDRMRAPAQSFLDGALLDELAGAIDPRRALPWPRPAAPGDTIWMGAVDGEGRSVSFIQSVYWEFGSGVVLEDTGIAWQNRGSSFKLDPGARNALAPRSKPFHTLNPALFRFDDGRVMPYGTMGGEGQPQTQAAVFTRYAHLGQSLQESVSAPRWLLGKTWGEESTSLKLESRFDPALAAALADAGHEVEVLGAYEEVMGHAGALVVHPDGVIEGASDPRSDGAAVGY